MEWRTLQQRILYLEFQIWIPTWARITVHSRQHIPSFWMILGTSTPATAPVRICAKTVLHSFHSLIPPRPSLHTTVTLFRYLAAASSSSYPPSPAIRTVPSPSGTSRFALLLDATSSQATLSFAGTCRSLVRSALHVYLYTTPRQTRLSWRGLCTLTAVSSTSWRAPPYSSLLYPKVNVRTPHLLLSLCQQRLYSLQPSFLFGLFYFQRPYGHLHARFACTYPSFSRYL